MYTMYTIYTICTMLTKVANPLGKPHKTKQKRDSREAIATPLRKQKKNVHIDQGVRGRAHVWASLSLIIACFLISGRILQKLKKRLHFRDNKRDAGPNMSSPHPLIYVTT